MATGFWESGCVCLLSTDWDCRGALVGDPNSGPQRYTKNTLPTGPLSKTPRLCLNWKSHSTEQTVSPSSEYPPEVTQKHTPQVLAHSPGDLTVNSN